MRHYIELSEHALLQILMNGIEAFVVIHNNRKRSGVEIHGYCFGSTENTTTTMRHKIDFFSADTSSVMMPEYCISDRDNRTIKSEIARSFSKNNKYQLIGSLHTHPYPSFEIEKMDNINQLTFMRNVGSHFSKGDRDCFLQKFKDYNLSYIIEGVFAINDRPRQSFEGDGQKEENMFEFSVGNLKCFIRFQVFSSKNSQLIEEKTFLNCDYLKNFHYIASSFDFGRIKLEENKQRILEYKPA
jgi:hypothetical protein